MRRFLFASLLLFCLMVQAESKFKLGKGQLTVTNVARNAVRIQYAEGTIVDSLPDWLYVKHGEVSQGDVKVTVKIAAPHSDHGSENAVRAVEFSISPIVDGRATVKARYKGKEKIFLIN